MTPKEQNIYNVLNLLVLLYSTKKQRFPKLSEEEQSTLYVTKENLSEANISILVFMYTLNYLDQKGYLFAYSGTSKEFHEDKNQLLNKETFEKVLSEIENKDTTELEEKAKEATIELAKKTFPTNIDIDLNKLSEEEFSLTELLEDGKKLLENYDEETVSVVLLNPFRSIEKLFEKLNNGEKFDDIQDQDVWLDANKCELHIGKEIIKTSYQNRSTYAQFALETLFTHYNLTSSKEIEYKDVDVYDIANDKQKEDKRFRDSLNGLFKKNPKCKEYFTVKTDGLALNIDN